MRNSSNFMRILLTTLVAGHSAMGQSTPPAFGPSGFRDSPPPDEMSPPTADGIAAAGVDVPLGGTNEPAVAVNPLDPMNVAASSLFSYRVSVDGGASYLGPTGNVVPAGYSRDGDPSLAFGTNGRLFYSYQGRHTSSGGADEFVSELDPSTGALLRGPFKVTTTGTSANYNDKDWLAVDRSPESRFRGRMHLVWSEFPTVGIVRVRTSFSTDDGATWSPALTLSTGAEGFPWPAHIAVAPNGDVYISYHSQPFFLCNPDGSSGQIVVVRSTDGGLTYPQKTFAFGPGLADVTYNVQTCADGKIAGAQFWTQGSGQAWVLPDPHIDGHLYVVAADDPDNNHDVGDQADVYIARSTDYGATWEAPIRVDDGPGTSFQLLPTAAIDEHTGCIAVMWYDNRAGALNGSGRYLLDVRYAVSADRGLTFGPSIALNDAPFDPDRGAPVRFAGPPPTTRIGEYIGVAMSGGNLQAVWCGNTVTGQQTITDSQLSVCPVTPPAASAAEPGGVPKSRYISFSPAAPGPGATSAIRVRLVDLHNPAPPDFSASNDEVRYVGPPGVCPETIAPNSFACATLQCAPHYRDWSGLGTVHVTGSAVVPLSRYTVRMLDAGCMGTESTCGAVSPPLEIVTGEWGDIVTPFGAGQPTFADISAGVSAFQGAPVAVIKSRAQMQPSEPNPMGDINFADISRVVGAFQGASYPFAGPAGCP